MSCATQPFTKAMACPFDFNAYSSRGEAPNPKSTLKHPESPPPKTNPPSSRSPEVLGACREVFGITRLSRRPELAGLGFFGLAGALVATSATQANRNEGTGGGRVPQRGENDNEQDPIVSVSMNC